MQLYLSMLTLNNLNSLFLTNVYLIKAIKAAK